VYYSIGEESYSSGTRPPLTDSPTFCVDPIGKFPGFLLPLPIPSTFPRNALNKYNPLLSPFLPRGTGLRCASRRHNQLRTRLPLRMHLPRPNRSARPSPRGDLQPLPRAPLHRRARRRLLPAYSHRHHLHLHLHLHHRGPTAPPARASKRAAAARAGGCAHRGGVGLGPRARSDTSQGGQLFASFWCAAAWRHGSLSALGRERCAELCACCTGRVGHVLVRFFPSSSFFPPPPPSYSFLISLTLCRDSVVIAIVGRSDVGTFFFPVFIRADDDYGDGGILLATYKVMGCLRASQYFWVYPQLKRSFLGGIGRYRDRARSRRLRHGLQGRTTRRCRNGSDPHRPTLPRHPRCGGNLGTCRPPWSLPKSDAQTHFLYLILCPAHPVHSGGEQSRRAEAHSAGILRYSRGYPPRRINKKEKGNATLS
jgi:hypothetical protein